MADPQVILEDRVRAALVDLGPEAEGADPQVRRSQHADFQVNAAFGLAKALRRKPAEIAEALAAAVDLDGVAEVDVAPQGFLNLRLDPGFVSDAVLALVGDRRLGVRPAAEPTTVVVDYSAPNVAKEMHVGHLRSTVIGDALARMAGFLGDDVVRQNHLGDWGTPFGMLIEHLVDVGEQEASAELSVGDLNGFYQQARAKFDGDEAFADRARRRVVALQAGDADSLALWQRLVDESTRYFSKIYDDLDVTLSDGDYAGESTYNDDLDAVVDELVAAGILVDDDGALCAFPPGFTGREGEPQPLIVRKSDGGYGYAATDLAAIRHRTKDLRAGLLLYVVGAPQATHLEMVFEVARMAGWLAPPAEAVHVAFGNVLGADGKMFRTRAGDTVKLAELLAEAERRALAVVQEKNPDLDPEAQAAVARAVGIGAVKYADLSADRKGDYRFDWDRMLALQGNTAPYLQYAHARIRSLLHRADDAGIDRSPPAALELAEPIEWQLALTLLAFDGAVHEAFAGYAPHKLCTYLFELATTYTTFYETCPVLAAEGDVRSTRLTLSELTARTLASGLGLLGITAPQRI